MTYQVNKYYSYVLLSAFNYFSLWCFFFIVVVSFCFVVYVFFPPLVGKVLVLQFVNFMTSSIFKFVL